MKRTKIAFDVFCSAIWILGAILVVHDWWIGAVTEAGTMLVAVGGALYMLSGKLLCDWGDPPEKKS
jgi:hypothetical protein